jgi:predicted enzyme involved in methoxymalonyl-ACP biosynthesis
LLDLERYREKLNAEGIEAWLSERVQQLRGLVNAPILVVACGADSELCTALTAQTATLPEVRICDPSPIATRLGASFLDQRAAALSGTTLSNAACIQLARELACHWIPAALWPPIKAIAVDLDNTLYQGVLGEDGPENIVLSDAHAALQQRLLELNRRAFSLPWSAATKWMT